MKFEGYRKRVDLIEDPRANLHPEPGYPLVATLNWSFTLQQAHMFAKQNTQLPYEVLVKLLFEAPDGRPAECKLLDGAFPRDGSKLQIRYQPVVHRINHVLEFHGCNLRKANGIENSLAWSSLSTLPPPSADQDQWSANMFCAHERIANACMHADTLLERDDSEPLRFKISMEKLMNECLPLLEAMETSEYDLLGRDWIEEAVASLGQCVMQLYSARLAASEQEMQKVLEVKPITIIQTGKPGQPHKNVNIAFLKEAMSPKQSISAASLAKMLGMHRNTLVAYMKRNGVVREFKKLSDHDLDLLVKKTMQETLAKNNDFLIIF
ncbi:hypothetical protein K439DRAFT_1533338 [Ramaria rubella]|nr:hypothetical protein K439DRAFT_1533338 [Ramaria rubella]